MPSKASRAASRQARLSRKKRRGGKGRQDFELGPEESVATTEAAVEDADIETQDEAGAEDSSAAQPSATATATRTRSRAQTPRRTRQQRAAEATPGPNSKSRTRQHDHHAGLYAFDERACQDRIR